MREPNRNTRAHCSVCLAHSSTSNQNAEETSITLGSTAERPSAAEANRSSDQCCCFSNNETTDTAKHGMAHDTEPNERWWLSVCSCAAIFKRKTRTQRNCAPRNCHAISFAREPLSIYNQNIIRCLETWRKQVENKTANICHLNANRWKRERKKNEKQIHNSFLFSAISFSDYFSFVRFHLRAVRAPLICWYFFFFFPCIMSELFFVGFCSLSSFVPEQKHQIPHFHWNVFRVFHQTNDSDDFAREKNAKQKNSQAICYEQQTRIFPFVRWIVTFAAACVCVCSVSFCGSRPNKYNLLYNNVENNVCRWFFFRCALRNEDV